MGYQSDVAICVSEKLYQDFISDPARKKILDSADEIKVCDDDGKGNKYYLWFWDMVKWYSTQEDTINLFLNKHHEDCFFLRIGENHEDIDDFGSYNPGDIHPYIIRKIECNDRD
jgi:hypothetical protein